MTNVSLLPGHVVPEALLGGPIALVKDGDKITIDSATREIIWHVDEEEQARRKVEWDVSGKHEYREKRGILYKYARDVAVSALDFRESPTKLMLVTSRLMLERTLTEGERRQSKGRRKQRMYVSDIGFIAKPPSCSLRTIRCVDSDDFVLHLEYQILQSKSRTWCQVPTRISPGVRQLLPTIVGISQHRSRLDCTH